MDPKAINRKAPKTWKWGTETVRERRGGPSWLFQALRMKEAAASLLMWAVSNRGTCRQTFSPKASRRNHVPAEILSSIQGNSEEDNVPVELYNMMCCDNLL